MKIEAIELRAIDMTLRTPFETSFGREQVMPFMLVHILTDGLEGWGEAPTGFGALYNEETRDTVWSITEQLIIPLLLGREVPSPQGFAQQVAHIRRNHMAKAAVEAALWDLEAQRQRKPLAKVLGGERSTVQVGVSQGIEPTIDELLARVGGYLGQGYRRIKIKIKPGWDLEPVRRIRKQFGDILLQVDANSAYALSDAATFKALDDDNLLLVEQPLEEDDIVDHAKLQAQLRTPVCLDESIVHERAARAALELRACRVINIKPARVGGLSAAVAIHDLCRSQQIPVWCGGMLETGIGRAHNIHLATMPGFVFPGDTASASRTYARDITEQKLEATNGVMPVPSGAGIGVTLDRDFVKEVTESVEVIRR